MISKIKEPQAVSLAENPVVFGFKSNNQNVSPGSQAKIILYFNQVISTGSGYLFRLSFGGSSYTFTMAISPDGSGLQFPRAISSDNNLTWMKKIGDALFANFYISDAYNITYTYNQVILTAKNTGSDYDIIGQNISVQGLSVISYPATDQQIRKFFKIFMQVIMDGKEISARMLPVDASGRSYFDISEQLRPELSNGFLFPEDCNNVIIQHPEYCKPYSVRFGEYYLDNDVPVIHRLYDGGTYRALKGGVNTMTQARYNTLNTSFYGQLSYRHKFLTNHPGNKKTAPGDIQKLYYLVHTSLQSHQHTHVNLWIGLHYYNSGGSVLQTQTYDKGNINASLFNVFEICCGYNRLQLDVNASMLSAGSSVYSYDVFLRDDAGNMISEVKSFILDDRPYISYRQFIFRNSLGAYETFRAIADQVRDADYTNTVYSKMRRWNFTERDHENKKDKSLELQKFIVNSGLIEKDEMNWFRDIFLSKEVYEVRDGILFPIVITSENVSLGKDREFTYNVQFEYIHAYTDEHYSSEKNVTKLTSDHVVILNDVQQMQLGQISFPAPAPVIFMPYIDPSQIQNNSNIVNHS